MRERDAAGGSYWTHQWRASVGLPNAKWTDPVTPSLRAILTCIHAGLHEVKGLTAILPQNMARIYGSTSPCLPDPVTHCSLGYKRSEGLATPSGPRLSTLVSIIVVLTSL
jgi:hypothetical protein